MWGLIPAGGADSTHKPLAVSRELLPLGSRMSGGVERPKAVSEFVVERMVRAGVDKLCFVISPGKADVVRHYGSNVSSTQVCYVVQPEAHGLCDALFRALPLVRADETVLVGLPDTVWFPEDGYAALSGDALSFLLFSVAHPERYDAVVTDDAGHVRELQVKKHDASSRWVWGGFRLSGRVLADLHTLWRDRACRDTCMGTLVNAYIARGGDVLAAKAAGDYFDVGTLDGYCHALDRLSTPSKRAQPFGTERGRA